MSIFNGEGLRLEIYGGSHEKEIGVRISGIPKGTEIDERELAEFMARRAPGKDEYSTPRKEADAVEFICGVRDGVCTGEQIHAVIRSNNTRSSDYAKFSDVPRPSHADYVASVKYGGSVNMSGGGPFSGRMTAPLCIAGGIALQALKKKGITVGAHLYSVGAERDASFDLCDVDADTLQEIKKKPFPVLDTAAGERMGEEILKAKAEGDSIGAVIECAAVGLPVGLGGPLFEGIESRISALAFGVGAVRGIEFGLGFAAAGMRGSVHNDPFIIKDGKIATKTNNAGGIVGGITNGMPVVFRVAMKPTPSIAREQDSVSISRMQPEKLTIVGRHDPCVAVRAVPVFEAVAALAILDAIGQEN